MLINTDRAADAMLDLLRADNPRSAIVANIQYEQTSCMRTDRHTHNKSQLLGRHVTRKAKRLGTEC